MRTPIALVLLALVACGGHKSPAPNSEPATQVEPVAAPIASEPLTMRFNALSGCTRMACPPEDACCNNCHFGGWGDGVVTVEAQPGVDVPACEVDGCGKCAKELEVHGTILGSTFRADSATLVEP